MGHGSWTQVPGALYEPRSWSGSPSFFGSIIVSIASKNEVYIDLKVAKVWLLVSLMISFPQDSEPNLPDPSQIYPADS